MRVPHGELHLNFLIIISIFCNKFGSVRFDGTELQNELNLMHSGYEDDEFVQLIGSVRFDRTDSNFLKKKTV